MEVNVKCSRDEDGSETLLVSVDGTVVFARVLATDGTGGVAPVAAGLPPELQAIFPRPTAAQRDALLSAALASGGALPPARSNADAVRYACHGFMVPGAFGFASGAEAAAAWDLAARVIAGGGVDAWANVDPRVAVFVVISGMEKDPFAVSVLGTTPAARWEAIDFDAFVAAEVTKAGSGRGPGIGGA